MATLTIRNLDDQVVEQLKAQAKSNQRSLEAEVRALLTDATLRPSRKGFLEIVDRIAAMTPQDVRETDSTGLIREFRDRQ